MMKADIPNVKVPERPILFSGPMVRVLLEGRKTQTRRVCEVQPVLGEPCEEHRGKRIWKWTGPFGSVQWYDGSGYPLDGVAAACPHGSPGDRLWVREAWRTSDDADCLKPRELMKVHPVWYECDGSVGHLVNPSEHEKKGRYRHARFMMRWMSRLTLGVVSVRVERLQDISEEDAKAEGVEVCGYMENKDGSPHYIASYRALWDQINGVGAWEKNPWVWVVEFKRVVGA